MFVFFPDEEKIGVRTVKAYFLYLSRYIEKMKKDGVTRAILIVRTALTPTARQVLQEPGRYVLESFLEAELLFNIMEHEVFVFLSART